MRNIIILACFVGLILMGCQTKVEKSDRVIMTLFDLSESTATPIMRTAYINGFKEIIKSVREGDVLIGASITDKSIQQLALPVMFECPVFKPTTDNPLLRKGEEEEFKKKLVSAKEEQIRTVEELLLGSDGRPKIIKTDILSSLVLASEIFKRYPEKRRILFIFSDMIEDSESYNFEKLNLNGNKIKEIIEKEKSENRIPNLTGIRIYVTGAQARSQEKYNSIKKFWIEYLKETGAELVDYGSSFLGLRE